MRPEVLATAMLMLAAVTETLSAKRPGKFYQEEYPIPEKLTKGKSKMTVKFVAETRGIAGGVLGCAMLKGH